MRPVRVGEFVIIDSGDAKHEGEECLAGGETGVQSGGARGDGKGEGGFSEVGEEREVVHLDEGYL